MPRRTAILIGLISVFLLIYTGWYYCLSRRGYAEADAWRCMGFYYFTPEDSDTWRVKNYGCAIAFYPANAVDRAIGLGRASASEPLMGFSTCAKK